MTTDDKSVSDDRLREIIAGCEGVTPFGEHNLMRYDHGGGRLAIVPVPGDGERILIADFYNWPEREHFTRLDPQTVTAICEELLARRSQQTAEPEPDAYQQRDLKHDGTWGGWYPTDKAAWDRWSQFNDPLFQVRRLYASAPVGGAVGLDAKLRSLATTLEAYGLDYMQARHVIEKVAALASSERSGREAVDLAEIERVARKVNPGRSEDHIKSVALDALSIIHALSQNPGTSNTSGEAGPVAWRFKADTYVYYDDAYVYCATEEMALLRCPKNSKVEPLYAALEPRASDREAVAHGLELAAKWHDQRARDTPDAFETEFHQVSAAAIRKLSEVSHEH